MIEPTEKDRANWKVFLDEIKLTLMRSVFETWFRGLRLEGFDENGVMILSTANNYAQEWLQTRLMPEITRHCGIIWGRIISVQIIVRKELPAQLTFVSPIEPVPKETVPTNQAERDGFLWGGFEGLKANYTQIPNEFIQNVIPYVSSSVAILVLMTFRYTVGEFADRAGNREDEWVTTKKGVEMACNISRSSFYTAIWDARAHGLLIYRPIEDDLERKHLCRKWKLTVEKRQEMFALRPRWQGEMVDYPETPRHGR